MVDVVVTVREEEDVDVFLGATLVEEVRREGVVPVVNRGVSDVRVGVGVGVDKVDEEDSSGFFRR